VTETFLQWLPETLVRDVIWPRIVETGNILDTFKRMEVLRSVCRSWANWIKNHVDYQDGIQAYSEGGFLDERVCYDCSMSKGRERDPGDWSSEDWIEEYLSDNI
jgi:hypothetical protein